MITEIGGTVGDIESLPFLEAIRQLQTELGRDRCIFVHLTLVPFIGHAGELKTKPTQHSVNELRRIGIQPDMVVCRSEEALSREIRAEDRAVREPAGRGGDLRPRRRRHLQGAADVPRRGRGRPDPRPLQGRGARPRSWRTGRRWCGAPARRATPSASRWSASTCSSRTPTCRWSRRCSTPASTTARRSTSSGSTPRRSTRARPPRLLDEADGILIPGGFGVRGIEGKINAARFARERADAVPGHLPRHAARGGRLRPPRGGHGRRELGRVRPRDALPGDRPAAGAEGGRRHGRHDAPGRRPREAPRRTRARAPPTTSRSSTSATATATRSTTCCAAGSRTRAWCAAARRRTTASSR